MDVGFGTALVISGGLLALAAALTGVMRGTVIHGATDTLGTRWIDWRVADDGSAA